MRCYCTNKRHTQYKKHIWTCVVNEFDDYDVDWIKAVLCVYKIEKRILYYLKKKKIKAVLQFTNIPEINNNVLSYI